MIKKILLLLAVLQSFDSTAQCASAPGLSLVSRTSNSIEVATPSNRPFHQLEYGPLGFVPGSGTISQWFAGSSIVVTSLSGSTGYDFYVRDSCINGSKSPWSSYFGYATSCTLPSGAPAPASIPWVENFDQIHFTPRPSATVPGLYMCGWMATPTLGYAWVSAPPFQPIISTGPSSDHSGRSKYLFADRFGAFTSNSNATIRSPQINLSGATVPVVEFWYHMFGSQIDSLLVEASVVGSSSWVRLGSIPHNSSLFPLKTSPWQQQVFPLTMFVNQTVTLRFTSKSSATFPVQARVAIDDIRVGQAIGCIAPFNLNFSGVQASSANANLVLGASQNHLLSFGAPGIGAGGGTIKRFSGTNTTISGLSPNTTYEAWVRDSCGPTSFSTWVGPVQFTTSCLSSSAPWSESFNATTWTVPAFNQSGTWPNCWDRPSLDDLVYVVGPPQFSSFNTGPSEDHGPANNGKYVYLRRIGFTNGSSGSFKTPWINLTPVGVPELTFWYHAYGIHIASTILQVEDTAGVVTQVWSATGQIQTAKTDPWTEVTVSLAAFANKKVRLQWIGSATTSFASQAQSAIDDIDIHQAPSCPKPLNFVASTVSSNTVTLSWTMGSSPWVVKYGPAGFNPATSGTRVTATSNPFLVGGLTPNTAYNFYVKDSCSASSVSAWSSVLAVSTTCTAVNAPTTESFQSSTWIVGTWPNLQGSISPCWSRSAGSTAAEFFWSVGLGPMQAAFTGPNQGVNGGKYLYTLGFGSSGTNQADMVSPLVNTTPLNVPMLRFRSHLFGPLIDRLEVFADSGSGWNSILTVLPGNQTSTNSAWSLHEVPLPAYADQTVRFQFRGQKLSASFTYAEIGLDEFAVVEAPIPSCSSPSTLTASAITITSAQIGFTAGGGSTRIALGPVGFTPTNAQVVASGIANPYPLTGLTAGTAYHVYLKDTCASAGLASAWVGPLAVTTQPCPAVSAAFTYSLVGGNLIMNAQNSSPTTNYWWTLMNSSGVTVATRTGASSTIPVSGSGTFTLSLAAANFCGSTDTTQVTVVICAPLGSGFSYTVNGTTVSFVSLAVNSSGQLWDYGDGNTGSGASPTHSYAVSGPYTVVMRSYNTCGDTISSSQIVVTCSKPIAEWTAQVLSSGGAGMRVEFQATPWSSVDAINFQWFFGDGTTGNGANPTKVYGVPGLFYQVTLVASNICGGKDSLTKSLTTVGLDEPDLRGAWFPNPASPGQWITSPSDSPIQVATMSGQMLSWTQRSAAGVMQVFVPEDCPSGVYLLWQNDQAARITVP